MSEEVNVDSTEGFRYGHGSYGYFSSNIWIWIVIGIVILVLLCGDDFFGFRRPYC